MLMTRTSDESAATTHSNSLAKSARARTAATHSAQVPSWAYRHNRS